MSKTTPTKGHLILKGLVGTVDRVIRMANGNLIVGLVREGQVENLMKIEKFGDIPCRVMEYQRMNTKKGVIRCPAFHGITEEEIVEDLAPEGVVGAKKIFFTRENQKTESNTIILTFDGAELPKEIKAGYINIKVNPYIPNPLRCFNCNKFGHPKDRCKRKACCARCGGTDHTDDRECRRIPHCTNCEGEHSSFSKDCPSWKVKKEIQWVRVLNNISFLQAKQQVSPTSSGQLYTSVVKRKTNTISVGTQTDDVVELKHPSEGTSASHLPQSQSESDVDTISPTPPSILNREKTIKKNDHNPTNWKPLPSTPSNAKNISENYLSKNKKKKLRKLEKKLQGASGEETIETCEEMEEMETNTLSSPHKEKPSDRCRRSPIQAPR